MCIRDRVERIGGDDQVGKDLAMHIAAAKPKALDSTGVAADLIETERRIAIEKAREAGKPEAMIEKIADGTVQKDVYKRQVLLYHAFDANLPFRIFGHR